MKLKVPLVSQPKKSVDCGIASVAMILKYYKIPISYSKLQKDIGVFSYGTYAPQLGLYLLEHGFDVQIATLHPRMFNIGHKFKTKKQFIAHLNKVGKNLTEKWDKTALKFFIKFIEAGGIIDTQIPNEKIIEKEIKAGRPIISSLTHWFLFPSKYPPRFTLHFNVVSGIDKKNVYVNDPDWGKPFGGKHRHNLRHYMYAIHASAQSAIDNACLILIKKKWS